VVFHAQLTPVSDTGVLYLRSTCTDPTGPAELGCGLGASSGAAVDVRTVVSAAETISAIVDSADGAGGYNLNFSLSLCGNRTLDAGETCDDGNFVGADGCETTCTLTTSPASSACATATPLTINPGVQAYTGDTGGSATGNFMATCASGNNKARLYSITTPMAGTLRIDLAPAAGYTGVLTYASAGTCPVTTTTCTAGSGNGAAVSITGIAVTAAQTSIVVVSGASGSGTYSLTFTLN
jgi:cysteine-rich repeat protein